MIETHELNKKEFEIKFPEIAEEYKKNYELTEEEIRTFIENLLKSKRKDKWLIAIALISETEKLLFSIRAHCEEPLKPEASFYYLVLKKIAKKTNFNNYLISHAELSSCLIDTLRSIHATLTFALHEEWIKE